MNSSLQSAVQINKAIRTIVISGIGEIPYVGWLVGDLVGFLWPTGKKAVWNQIVEDAKEQLSALLEKDFNEYTLDNAATTLQGLNNVLDNYLTALNDPGVSTDQKRATYDAAVAAFSHDLPVFQEKGFEVLLLPLYAQAVNLGIGLFRDGAAFGDELGLNEHESQNQQAALDSLVSSGLTYVENWVGQGHATVEANAKSQYGTNWGPGNYVGNEVFNAVNQYDRYMALSVTDLSFMWSSLQDATFSGPMPPNTREIYSDVFGCLYEYPPQGLVPASDQPMIDGLRMWGWDAVDAVQQSYAGSWGPRLGDQASGSMGGSDDPPHGWNGPVTTDNPVTIVEGLDSGWINAMTLHFADGTATNQIGGNYPGGGPFTWSFASQIVSQLYFEGKASGPNSAYAANAGIIGFRFQDSYT